MGEPVIMHARVAGQPDRYGDPTYTDVDVTVDDVAVAPAGSSIDAQTGATITTRGFTLYLPHETSVPADAQFTVRGVRYAVEGASQDWRNFYDDWLPGNVVVLQEHAYVDGVIADG